MRDISSKKTFANHFPKEYQSQTSALFENPYWDVKKVAEKLSVSQATLRDWVYKRQIPFKKVGNLVRFDPHEILQWVDERSSQCLSKYEN